MSTNLLFLAGPRAYQRIRDNGLYPSDIKMVVGASGAAKWLVLHGLESAIFSTWFADRTELLHLYGTSIGSWKSVAAAQMDAAGGFDRLAQAYIHQYYRGKITAEQITREAGRIMEEFVGPGVPEEVLSHPYCRVSFSAVRCRGLLASDNPKVEMLGLIVGWLLNRLSRRFFQRMCKPTLFHHPTAPPPFSGSDEFSGGSVPLTTDNFRQALLASGSIPCVMKSVRNLPGAPSGAYRDGGLFHYHPAFDFMAGNEGIVLYPHFYSELTLGWLDKNRSTRIVQGAMLPDTLVLAPSPDFVASLPLGRIPDRRDFERLSGKDEVRVSYWEKAVAMSNRLGAEFLEAVGSGQIRKLVKEIP